jgi:toxin ParE1/3/4
VEIFGAAQDDAERIFDFIASDNVTAARRWFRNFHKHARSLRTMPFRHEQIPEADRLGIPLRHVIFGNYRILFFIAEEQVTVVRVIHAARDLKPGLFRF